MRLLTCILSSLLLASTLASVAGAPAAAVRKSADGIDFPPAPAERKFRVKVAIGGHILGQRPEEVGHVFNAKKSAALLAKRTTQDLGCEWFVINAEGADVVGLGLTDGRVSKVVLFYDTATATRVANLRKQLEASADHSVAATIKPIDQEKKHSLLLRFEVDPIEFYLATHTVDPKVGEALRQRVWVAEMSDDEAILVGDGPGKYAAVFSSDMRSDAVGKGTVFAESGAPDVVVEFTARNKQDAREQALKKNKNLKSLKKVTGSGEGATKK